MPKTPTPGVRVATTRYGDGPLIFPDATGWYIDQGFLHLSADGKSLASVPADVVFVVEHIKAPTATEKLRAEVAALTRIARDAQAQAEKADKTAAEANKVAGKTDGSLDTLGIVAILAFLVAVSALIVAAVAL